jgi:hypothetical protein
VIVSLFAAKMQNKFRGITDCLIGRKIISLFEKIYIQRSQFIRIVCNEKIPNI